MLKNKMNLRLFEDGAGMVHVRKQTPGMVATAIPDPINSVKKDKAKRCPFVVLKPRA